MKDIVIGCITGYNFKKIEPWVNSLDNCGFTGAKAMICYNVDYETTEQLVKRGYSIFAFEKNDKDRRFEYNGNDTNFSIVVERFYHLWYFLKGLKGQYRNIITTDVKDVVFQTNPSLFLERVIKDGKKINVACESIRYKDEDWGDNNLLKSFGPLIHKHNRDNLIYNAGTISGDFDTMIDVFLNIYLMCVGLNPFTEGGGGPDQAALNILLQLEPYKSITNFAMSEDGYAAQLGTTGPQIQGKYGDRVVEKTPILVDNMVCTSTGQVFSLVHQYDRVPEWKELIEKKYGDMNNLSPQEWINHQLLRPEYISGKGVADIVNKHFSGEVVGCEVGVCLGITSEYYMKSIPKLKKLYCVDNYPEYVDWNNFVFNREKQDAMKNHAYERLKKFKNKVEFVYEHSYVFAKTVEQKTFDFVFIDGDHSFDGCLRDLESYYPLVKENGIFAGHDYSMPHVNKALRTFLKEDFDKVKELENNAWYLIK